MLERTVEQLSDFEEILLSANDPALSRGLPAQPVSDIWPDCGPLGGLHASLLATRREGLFCVPCDLPQFTANLPRLLLKHMDSKADSIICRDSTGRLHPLCGIYRRRVIPVLEEQLLAGDRRMTALANHLDCQILDTAGILPDAVFWNMNTPKDYRQWKGSKQGEQYA